MAIYERAPEQPLEQQRRARGWTQDALSGKSGVCKAEISRIERGWLKPSPGQAVRLATALGVQPGDLLPKGV
jgi:transcriptional regulator with XRE-family HTH domain